MICPNFCVEFSRCNFWLIGGVKRAKRRLASSIRTSFNATALMHFLLPPCCLLLLLFGRRMQENENPPFQTFSCYNAKWLNFWQSENYCLLDTFPTLFFIKKNFSMSNNTTEFFHIKQCNENHQVMACVWSLYYSGSHMFDLDGCDLVDDVMGKTGKRPSIEKVKTCTFCPLMGTRFKIRFLSPSSNVATKTVFCLQSFLFLMKFR